MGAAPPRARSELIVRRPAEDAREVLAEGELDLAVGLVGDTWEHRPSRRTADGGPHPDMQLNIMNARAAALVAQRDDRWALAGDQLFVDLDLSRTRLDLTQAVVEGVAFAFKDCFDVLTAQSATQWQRLAKLRQEAELRPGVYVANFKDKAWRARMWRPVRFTHRGLRFVNKTFRVIGLTLRNLVPRGTYRIRAGLPATTTARRTRRDHPCDRPARRTRPSRAPAR